jgi:glycerol-3-phosphate acyltransferase PlsY
VTELLINVGLSYLLGSILGGLVVGRLRGGVDVRRLGSGNAGATNALRTQGKGFAFWVLLIDVGKGWLATHIIAQAYVPGLDPPASWWRLWFAAACGIAVMVGHVYPLWYGFRGGKAVATLVGATLGIYPWLLIPMLLAWLATVVLVGFVGLASMVGAAALAVALILSGAEPQAPLRAFGIVTALMIAFTHRANIARMRAGTEPRARRLWLFGLNRRRA